MMIVDGKLNKQIAASLSIAEQTAKVRTSAIFRLVQKIHAEF